MTSVANQRSSRDSGYDIDRLISMYEIEDADLDRIREFGKGLITRLDRYIELFYEWMGPLPEYETFFSDPIVLLMRRKCKLATGKVFSRLTSMRTTRKRAAPSDGSTWTSACRSMPTLPA